MIVRRVSAAPRILALLMLIAILVLGGLLWFDYLGITDTRQLLKPVLSLVGIESPQKVANLEDSALLERQRFEKRSSELELWEQELERREQKIESREAELDQMLEDLKEREEALKNREKSFNERANMYENRKANLEQNAEYLIGMPPEDAVNILKEMDDQDVIDTMRTAQRLAEEAGEVSIVSYWLSLMPSERAATIQRKMTDKPGS